MTTLWQTLANTALDGLFCKWLICGWWFHSGLQAATAAPLTPWPSLKFDPQNDQNCMDHFWTCWIICGCLLPMYGIVRNSWHCKKCACLAVISLAGKGTYRGHYNWNLITWFIFNLLLLFWCPGALLFFLKHAYHCISRNGNKYQIIACHFISLLLGGNGNKNRNLALASDCFFMPGSTSCQTRNTNCSRWYLANVKAMVLFVDGGIYIYIYIIETYWYFYISLLYICMYTSLLYVYIHMYI